MPVPDPRSERPLVKTKIVATVGPACSERENLKALAVAGVDVFRLNFAHGRHEVLAKIVAAIRDVSKEVNRPLGLLGDLAGPKIRLGELPEEGLTLADGERVSFVRDQAATGAGELTCSYPYLLDDLTVGDRVLLADGVVALRVVELHDEAAVCVVEQPGLLRSRQGVNLPGVSLSTPSLTEKDHQDLAFALEQELDYIGLSFVRRAEDVRQLREIVEQSGVEHPPHIIAKIEKMEAISELDRILDESDAVMVARGDLGVEADIAKIPILQKRIIRLCNRQRVPVITATQMLESMQSAERPTRAEATDVCNAVLDGSDAVMLSAETAIGEHPARVVSMMSRIVRESERLVPPSEQEQEESSPRHRAMLVTDSVTAGAGTAAKYLNADVIVVATHSGRTALSVSRQRGQIPVLALTDRQDSARRMSLYWGVTPIVTDVADKTPRQILDFVIAWGRENNTLRRGDRIVLVTLSNWSVGGHDLMLAHAIP